MATTNPFEKLLFSGKPLVDISLETDGINPQTPIVAGIALVPWLNCRGF